MDDTPAWSEEMDARLILMRFDPEGYLRFALQRHLGVLVTDIFRMTLTQRIAEALKQDWSLVIHQDNYAVMDRVHERRWYRPWRRYERMFLHEAPTYLVERRWFT